MSHGQFGFFDREQQLAKIYQLNNFYKLLDSSGFKVKSGYIVDGSFVEVPKQRNTKAENEQIKNGEIPETLSKNSHVLAQKDCDGACF